jgi:hypothetical protein
MILSKKKASILIFLLAIIVRLTFVFISHAPAPTTWSDDGYYNDTAKSIYEIFSHVNILISEFLKGHLGRGGGVLSTYGLELPFGIFHRGIIHHVFIACIYLFCGLNNFIAVWISQAVLDSLTCLFTYFIGRRLFGEKVGFLASMLTVVYIPLILFTTKLFQETFITLLLLLTLLMFIRAIQIKSIGSFLFGGFCLFLLVTGRLVFMYLFLFMCICLCYLILKYINGKFLIKAISVTIISFFIPLLLWMFLIFLEFGRFGSIMVGPGAVNLYRSNLVLTEGEVSDENRLSLGPHLVERLKKKGFVWEDGLTRKWPPENVLYKAALREFQENPTGVVLVVLNKTRSLFLSVASRDPFTRLLHTFAIYTAVIGMVLAFFKKRISILLSIVVVYLSAVHSLVAVEPRYNIPFMPIMFIFSSYFVFSAAESYLSLDRKRKNTVILTFIVVGITYLLTKIISIPILLLLINKMLPEKAMVINLLVKNCLIVSLVGLIYALFDKLLNKKEKIITSLLPCLCFGILFNSGVLFQKDWKTWKVELHGREMRVRQEIVLSMDSIKDARGAYLKIDMEQSNEPIGSLRIMVNGEPIKVYQKSLSVENEPFFYFEYQYLVSDPARIRRWFSIPVSLSALKNDNPVDIELIYEDPGSGKGWVKLYGDYVVRGNEHLFYGPLFAKDAFQTSIHKYIKDGDYRIKGSVLLHNLGSESSYYNQGKWSSLDLSKRLGIQNGQFRIRLELIDAQGNSEFF